MQNIVIKGLKLKENNYFTIIVKLKHILERKNLFKKVSKNFVTKNSAEIKQNISKNTTFCNIQIFGNRLLKETKSIYLFSCKIGCRCRLRINTCFCH